MCKIVSIGLVVQSRDYNSTGISAYSADTSVDLINMNVWTPSIPSYPGLTVKPTELLQQIGNSETFNPLQNIDFGGEGGRFLSSLTRIVAHMCNEDMPIIGLEFIYNGSKKLFGLRGNIELSMIVNGAAGEQIIGVGIKSLSKEPYRYVQGVEVLFHSAVK